MPLAPSIEGVENVIFNSFVMGTPITNLKQANNTYRGERQLSRRLWAPTLSKPALKASYEQVNVNPNPTFNGSFLFSGTETGSDFADFLIGVASNYNQADSQAYYIRHKYAGGFAQDSWRIRPNLTLNYGVRWDLMEYWSEKYNQIPTFMPGEQSKVYPNALPGLVYPTDPGVPNTLVPSKQSFFAADRSCLVAREFERAAGQDHRRPGQDEHPRGLRHLLLGDRGQHHGYRRAAAALWAELHQPGTAAVCHAVHYGVERPVSRQSVSADVSSVERFGQPSQQQRRISRSIFRKPG